MLTDNRYSCSPMAESISSVALYPDRFPEREMSCRDSSLGSGSDDLSGIPFSLVISRQKACATDDKPVELI